MRTVGIIGGVGPESTIDYYKLLIETWQRRRGDGSYPSIIINSIDLQKAVAYFNAGDFAGVTAYLATEVQRLADAGAAFGAISANTPHVVFDEVQRMSAIPLISIVRAAAAAAKARGLRRLLLLGTRFTMSGTFYPEVFTAEEIELVTPGADEQAYIHDKYMNELVKGEFAASTRDRFVTLIERFRDEEKVEGVILAGTELPLLLRETPLGGLEMLDTTRVHVDAIVEQML
jgi:aspartate racemase